MKSEDLEICIKKLRDGIQQLGSVNVPSCWIRKSFQGLNKVVQVHNFMVELKDQQIKEDARWRTAAGNSLKNLIRNFLVNVEVKWRF